MASNQLSDFSAYIENLCKTHVDVLHSDDNKHFLELNDNQQLTDQKVLCYPLVTLEKLTVTYPGGEDFMNKNRYVEMMFLASAGKADFVKIQQQKNNMERIAEDYLKRIKLDKRDRKKYPFLRNLAISDIELNFVEIAALDLYGALLSFNFELSFDEVLDRDRFTDLTSES